MYLYLQVFNRTTYGHFEQFLEMLGVDSEESDMSFALSVRPKPDPPQPKTGVQQTR